MLKMYGYQLSPFSDKVRGILRYKGLDFEEVTMSLTRSREVRSMSTVGKLPILEEDGVYVADSTDIAYYLEEKYPDNPVIPQDTREAALVHMIEDWADESLFFYEVRLRFLDDRCAGNNIDRLVGSEGRWARWLLAKMVPRFLRKMVWTQGVGRKSHENVMGDVGRHVQSIANLLGDRDWLVGPTPTLADFAVYPMVKALCDAEEGRALIDKRRALRCWMERASELCD